MIRLVSASPPPRSPVAALPWEVERDGGAGAPTSSGRDPTPSPKPRRSPGVPGTMLAAIDGAQRATPSHPGRKEGAAGSARTGCTPHRGPRPGFVATPQLDLELERLRQALPPGWTAERRGRRFLVCIVQPWGGWAALSTDPAWLVQLAWGRPMTRPATPLPRPGPPEAGATVRPVHHPIETGAPTDGARAISSSSTP